MIPESWCPTIEAAVFLLLLAWMILDRYNIYFRKPPEEK